MKLLSYHSHPLIKFHLDLALERMPACNATLDWRFLVYYLNPSSKLISTLIFFLEFDRLVLSLKNITDTWEYAHLRSWSSVPARAVESVHLEARLQPCSHQSVPVNEKSSYRCNVIRSHRWLFWARCTPISSLLLSSQIQWSESLSSSMHWRGQEILAPALSKSARGKDSFPFPTHRFDEDPTPR